MNNLLETDNEIERDKEEEQMLELLLQKLLILLIM